MFSVLLFCVPAASFCVSAACLSDDFFLKTAVPHSESKTGTYGINNLLNLRKLLRPLTSNLLKSYRTYDTYDDKSYRH